MRRVCSVFVLFLVALPSFAQTAIEHLRELIASNSLDQEGKPPFHVKLEFQIYDLAGSPSEKGTVEEWWASPKLQRIAVTAPSLDNLPSKDTKTLLDQRLREQELIKELLAVELHPIPNRKDFTGVAVRESKQKNAKVPLQCVSLDPTDSKASIPNSFSYCADPVTNALRLRTDALHAVSRNTIGTFHGTMVGLDLQIAYADKTAITGHVAAMNSFDPATSKVDLSEPDSGPITEDPLSGTDMGVKILTQVAPVYPPIAKAQNVSGTVVLHAVISKQGTITQLAAIASPSPALTDAAEDAVRQWTYKPYLLAGEPAEVETTINVNFAFTH